MYTDEDGVWIISGRRGTGEAPRRPHPVVRASDKPDLTQDPFEPVNPHWGTSMRTEAARHLISSSATKTSVPLSLVILFSTASAQPKGRSSLVEDRAARKLLEAGDARYESDEFKQAVEVWQSVIERYP